jgi:hypothetical protein
MHLQLQHEIPDCSVSFYSKLLGRRRDWQPIEPSANQDYNPHAKATLQKALALSSLELPVGHWVSLELEKNLKKFPVNLAILLDANIEDEAKHTRVLDSLIKVFPLTEADIAQADAFTGEADRLANIYSPIVVAGVLEVSIFFVLLPMYRFLGGAGFRTVASDISNDEQVHVATNIQLALDLGYNRGQKLDDFRKSIVEWLVSDLSPQNDNKFLSSDYWLQSSDNLYYSGKNSNFSVTQNAVMPAFFETNASNLPLYN